MVLRTAWDNVFKEFNTVVGTLEILIDYYQLLLLSHIESFFKISALWDHNPFILWKKIIHLFLFFSVANSY